MLAFALGVVAIGLFPPVASAATWTVTNCNDSGAGSLRAAVASAASGDAIGFDLSPACSTITLTSGEVEIANSVTISGPGANVLAVSGGNASRVFQVDSGVTANISGLTIENGQIEGDLTPGGSGILNSGTLTLSNSTVADNVNGGGGGGIANGGDLTIIDSTVAGNSALGVGDGDAGSGGGIGNQGNLTVSNSTISGNTGLAGGGIFNLANFGANLSITNSTVVGNTATDGGDSGGGVYDGGDGGPGGAILKATIVAENFGGDCSAEITNGGYDIDDDGTCGFTGTGSLSNSSTLDNTLGPLQNDGGPTETMALLPGSPAIAQVPASDCPSTDQRGDFRGDPCDIGAYDTDTFAVQVITFTSTAPSNATVGGPTYAVTATGGDSGNPVTFTIDPAATSVCSISGAVASFIGSGTCTIDANQAGNTDYAPATPAQQSFAVAARPPPPIIKRFKPAKGEIGKRVTIKGSNLSGATMVTFNGTKAKIRKDTATEIVVRVPAGATTGFVTVTTAGGTAISAKGFKVT